MDTHMPSNEMSISNVNMFVRSILILKSTSTNPTKKISILKSNAKVSIIYIISQKINVKNIKMLIKTKKMLGHWYIFIYCIYPPPTTYSSTEQKSIKSSKFQKNIRLSLTRICFFYICFKPAEFLFQFCMFKFFRIGS